MEILESEGKGPKGNTSPKDIILNVYDMLSFNQYTSWIGIGVFHSGVQILEQEFSFGCHDYNYSGVYVVQPRVGPPGVSFRESIKMGSCFLETEDIQEIITQMSREYTGRSYNILSRNCNHFSFDLCERLTGQIPPKWINRLASLGTYLPSGIPRALFATPTIFDDPSCIDLAMDPRKRANSELAPPRQL